MTADAAELAEELAAADARDAALQTMLLALCLEAGADEEFRRDPVAFARRFGVDERDVGALVTDGKRLPLYRKLVRGAIGGTVRDVLGSFVTRLEAEAPGAFASCLDAFLAAGPRASHLREVPRAFFTASRPRLTADPRVAPWLLEAADAILTEHEVGAAADAGGASGAGGDTELALDRGLQLAPALAVRRYAFAVPDVDLDALPTLAPPARAATWLLVRDRDHATGWRELSPAAAAFVECVLAGDTLATSMAAALATVVTVDAVGATAATAAASEAVDAASIQTELTELLTELAAEGVLLGGTPP